MTTWTVIDEQRVHTVAGDGDALIIDPVLLGWDRKPEGLCRDEVCIPVPAGTPAGGLDAELLGRLVGRPQQLDEMVHKRLRHISPHNLR